METTAVFTWRDFDSEAVRRWMDQTLDRFATGSLAQKRCLSGIVLTKCANTIFSSVLIDGFSEREQREMVDYFTETLLSTVENPTGRFDLFT